MTTAEAENLDIRDAGVEILDDSRVEAFFNKPLFKVFPFLREVFKKAGILSQVELARRFAAQTPGQKNPYQASSFYLNMKRGQPESYPFGNKSGQVLAKILGPEIMATLPATERGKITITDIGSSPLVKAFPPLKAAFKKAEILEISDLVYALEVCGLLESSAPATATRYLKLTGNPAGFPFACTTGKRVAAILGVPDTTVPTEGFEEGITSFWESPLYKAYQEKQKFPNRAATLSYADLSAANSPQKPEPLDPTLQILADAFPRFKQQIERRKIATVKKAIDCIAKNTGLKGDVLMKQLADIAETLNPCVSDGGLKPVARLLQNAWISSTAGGANVLFDAHAIGVEPKALAIAPQRSPDESISSPLHPSEGPQKKPHPLVIPAHLKKTAKPG